MVHRSVRLLACSGLLACIPSEPGDTGTTGGATGASTTCIGDMCEATGLSGHVPTDSTGDSPTTGAATADATTTGATTGATAGTTADTDEPLIQHRFLAVDNGLNQLLLVDEIGGSGWTAAIPGGSRDLQLVADDRVLVSHGDGAAEYALADGAKGWSVSGYADIQTARRLPGGNTLLGGGTTDVTFYTVDADGMQVGSIDLPGYLELRLVRVLESGNLLFTATLPFRVVEVDPEGNLVWEAPLPDKGYTAERLGNGDTLATAGEPCLLVTIAPDGSVVRQLGGEGNFPDVGLDWFSGFSQLPGGNLVVANWLGHDAWGTGPHLVELTPDNAIVWSWADFEAAMQITNVLVLE